MCSWLIGKLGSQFMCCVMKTHSSGRWSVRCVLLLGVVQSHISSLADSRAATITLELLRKKKLKVTQ